MKTRLIKKHPLYKIEDMYIVKYDLARIGYKTREEAQQHRLDYLKKRYGKK